MVIMKFRKFKLQGLVTVFTYISVFEKFAKIVFLKLFFLMKGQIKIISLSSIKPTFISQDGDHDP